MLSNLSNTNNGNEASNHIIENKCYECLEEQIDEIKQKNNEQDVSISNNTSNIDALKDRVCAVECNRTFDNILVNCIRPKTSARVTIDGNLTARNVTASSVTANALSVNGTSFVSVANRSEIAITDAVAARCCANAAVTCAQNANTRVTNLENSLACCVVTDCVKATGSINVNNTITSSDVCTSNVYANKSDIGEIFTGKITANGQLPLPSAGANWYTITIPDGVTVNLTSKYIAENNTEYKWRVIVTDTQVSYKNEGSSIKDISYNRAGNTKVRVRASEDISYIRLANNAANEITIQSLGNAYNDYAYTPEKAAGTVFRGYNDRTTEVIQPGYLCATVIRGDAIEYCENTAECMTVTCKLFLPDEWNRTGMICRSSGADNQYLSNDTKDETISPTWKTPVECAVDGKLSNTKCLITEKAVSEYNGTVTDGTNDSYPISELNCCTCVHGTLNGECVCASDLIESCHGCFTCDMRAYEACSRWTHTDVVTSLDEQPGDAISFQSCTINACPSFFNAPSCFCDTIKVDCNADFGSNVHIAGDLFVSGTSHVVDEETIETPSNEIILRQNASVGLANSEISGIVVNKYNGSDSLTVGADNTGTLRVGTGTGTTTCYADICHNQTDNKWYLPDNTEVTPVGVLQSYATKVEKDPYTVYTDAVFMAVDKTSLEPVLTRDEETDLTQCGILYWDATNTKAKNASKIKYNNNGLDLDGKTCISAECTTITDGTNTTVIDASSVTSNCGCFVNATANEVCGVCCVTTPLACMCCALADNITTECSVCVKGDLIVCGNAAIAGLMSDCVATVQTNPYNVAFYPTFVACNYAVKGSSEIFTDCNLCYYPSKGSLCTNCVYANDYIYANCAYIPSALFDCASSNSLCVGTIGNYNLKDSANFKLHGISNTNFDFAMPIYSSQECQLLNCNISKLSYNCCGGPTYNPYTCTLKVPKIASSISFCHNCTATDWQNLAFVDFGATSCAFFQAACPDANGINVAFGNGGQTIIYASDDCASLATTITNNGAGEKVVLLADNSVDIVTCAQCAWGDGVWKWNFAGDTIALSKWNGSSWSANPYKIFMGSSTAAFGTNYTITCPYSTVVGYSARTDCGCYATAIGYNAQACCTLATAIGAQAKATGSGSTAIGCSANTTATGSIAIGTCAKAVIQGSVAIGTNTFTCTIGTACITGMVRFGDSRLSVIRWTTTTKQCDLWKAITCATGIGTATPNRQFGVMGTAGNCPIGYLLWDLPTKKYILGGVDLRGEISCFGEIYCACTATVSPAGVMSILVETLTPY